MTGDGTNDVRPRSPKADVGVAMNTGTRAAREAGNMVDLGQQTRPSSSTSSRSGNIEMLITRGSLHHLQHRQRCREVFRDNPGHADNMTFFGHRPTQHHAAAELDECDSERRHLQRADHYRAAIPPRPARRRLPPGWARSPFLQRNLLSTAGRRASCSRSSASKLIDLVSHHRAPTSLDLMKAFFSEIRGAVVSTIVLAIVCCGLYPLVVLGVAQLAFRDKANGSLIVDASGTVRRLCACSRRDSPTRNISIPGPQPPATATTPRIRAAATWDQLRRN